MKNQTRIFVSIAVSKESSEAKQQDDEQPSSSDSLVTISESETAPTPAHPPPCSSINQSETVAALVPRPSGGPNVGALSTPDMETSSASVIQGFMSSRQPLHANGIITSRPSTSDSELAPIYSVSAAERPPLCLPALNFYAQAQNNLFT